MRKLSVFRFMLIVAMLISVSMASWAKPNEIFVSQKAGKAGNNGASWHSAVKTFTQAVRLMNAAKADTTIIYMAEGLYEPYNENEGTNRAANYSSVMIDHYNNPGLADSVQNSGQVPQKLYVRGGYPTPTAATQPYDTCAYVPSRYVTAFTVPKVIGESVFKLRGNNTGIDVRGIRFNESNFQGTNTNGAFITIDGTTGASLAYGGFYSGYNITLKDIVIEKYKAGIAGFIGIYGGREIDINISYTEVFKGEGGGFIATSMAPLPANIRVKMHNCTFREMSFAGQAAGSAAIIGVWNGGYPNLGHKIDNSWIEVDNIQVNRLKNSVNSGVPGAIFAVGVDHVKVTNSVFRNCDAGAGSAMSLTWVGKVISENNIYENNTGHYEGGAIFISDNNSVVNTAGAATVAQCVANALTYKEKYGGAQYSFKNDVFKGNIGGTPGNTTGNGAAISVLGGVARQDIPAKIDIDGCQFVNNHTAYAVGSAVYLYMGCSAWDGQATIKNSQFCGNYSGTHAVVYAESKGAIYAKGDCNLNIDSCIFNSNTARDAGGAIFYAADRKLNVTNSVFEDNFSGTAAADARNGGGAIVVLISDTSYIKDCVFKGNKSKAKGGAISYTGNATKYHIVEGCTFEGNSTDHVGGAIGSYQSGQIDIRNSVFLNNTSTHALGGGALGIQHTTNLKINGCRFEGNTAPANAAISYDTTPKVDFANCSFEGNKTPGNGGVIDLKNISSYNSTVSFVNVEFKNNEAGGYGGAINVSKDGAHYLTLEGCQFENNKSVNGGGAISHFDGWVDGYMKVKHCNFVGNTATDANSYGGAIYTGLGAGGVYLEIDSNYFEGNSAGEGGAVYHSSGFSSGRKDCNMRGNRFLNNTATKANGGGAVYIYPSSGSFITVTDFKYNYLKGNSANGISDKVHSDIAAKTNGGVSLLFNASITNFDDNHLQLAQSEYDMYKIGPNKGFGMTSCANNTYEYTGDMAKEPFALPADPAEVSIPLICEAVVEPVEIDMTLPHAEIFTSDEAPREYSVVCEGDEHFVEFFSTSGQAPFTFYYDIYKTQNGVTSKYNPAELTVTTSEVKIPIDSLIDSVAVYRYETQNDTSTIAVVDHYEINVIYTKFRMDSAIRILNPIPEADRTAGVLYTFKLQRMHDGRGVETMQYYDCDNGIISTTYIDSYAQLSSASLYFKDCRDTDEDGVPDYIDVDDDNDGLLDLTECPIDSTTQTLTVAGKSGWFKQITGSVSTQGVFKDFVENDNYMNRTPSTGPGNRVLTLFPNQLISENRSNDINVDISEKFGLKEGSVVVKVDKYHTNKPINDADAHFSTYSSQLATTWTVSGTANPYVLLQVYPKSDIGVGQSFFIHSLDAKNLLSQTPLYVADHATLDTSAYTIYENQSYKKVVFHNNNMSLVDKLGLSYINVNDGSKSFMFSQTDESKGEIITAVTIMLPCDYDGDGIPNTTDTDSDNDGCFDIQEAVLSGIGDNLPRLDVDSLGRLTEYEIAENGAIQSSWALAAVGYSQDSTINMCKTPKAIDDINITSMNHQTSGNVLDNDQIISTATVSSIRYIDEYGSEENQDVIDEVNVEVYSVDGEKAGTLNVNKDGSYTFTPADGFVGEVVFSYDMYDNLKENESSSADVSISVLPVISKEDNNAPIAKNDNVQGKKDASISGSLTANDTDADGDTLTVKEAKQGDTTIPVGTSTQVSGITRYGFLMSNAGTIIINADGTFTFTPSEGFIGEIAPITYTAQDGKGGEDSADLNLTLFDNDGYTNSVFATDDAIYGEKGNTLTGNLLNNDYDPEGDSIFVKKIIIGSDTLEVSSVTPATKTIADKGTLTVNADGSYEFVPEAEFVGSVQAIYIVKDDKNPSSTDNATLYMAIVKGENLWVGTEDTDFSNEDNWTDHVPNAGESIIFATNANNSNQPAQNDLVLASDFEVADLINNLGEGGEEHKAVVVPAGISLEVSGSVRGFGEAGDVDKLVLKSTTDGSKPDASFIITNDDACDMNVYASVEMYSKASKLATSVTWTDENPNSPTNGLKEVLTHTWQYFGVPVQSIDLANKANNMISPSSFWLRQRKEEWNLPDKFYGKWYYLKGDETLEKGWGYEISQDAPFTYTFKGKLNLCDIPVTLTRKASEVAGVTGTTDEKIVRHELGQNVVANSYAASINVSQLEFARELDATAYIFNTGNIKDWADNIGTTSDSLDVAGAYMALPKNIAASFWDNTIPSKQGFMVKYTDSATLYSEDSKQLIFKYDGLVKNSKAQKIASNNIDRGGYLKVVVEGNNASDAVLLVEREGLTSGFDNGWDGMKMGMLKTALFVETAAGNMQVAADQTIVGKYITFTAKNNQEYTLRISKDNLGGYTDLKLIDLATATIVSLDEDETIYNFMPISAGRNEKRFLIARGIESDNLSSEGVGLLNAYVDNSNTLIVSNFTGEEATVSVFDMAGRRLSTHSLQGEMSEVNLPLPQGVYMLTLQAQGYTNTIKIVLH